MHIEIKQHEISLGAKYDIFIGGGLAYTAASQFFTLFREIRLFRGNSDNFALSITKYWSALYIKYGISRDTGETTEFGTVSYIKSHFRCKSGVDMYDIYGNTGRKHSIYKNNVQVAAWQKAAMTFMAGDTYSMLADNDADIELLIAFCLIMDDAKSRKGGMFKFNFGTLPFFTARSYNPNWRPKE